MHIVALAWMYVVLMMAITERSVVAGIMTFLLYGMLPLLIILYLMGAARRKRRRTAGENIDAEMRDAAASAAEHRGRGRGE